MNENYYLTPLARSKMLTKTLEQSPEDEYFDEQHEVYKEEISQYREFLSQSNIKHENRLRELRISYETQLQNVKKQYEEQISAIQNRLWDVKHSFEQEKQLHLTRSHRFVINKLEYSEKIEALNNQKQSLSKELYLLNNGENSSHQASTNLLKSQYDTQSTDFRIDKRRCEELIAEESCRLREKIEEKTQKIGILLERKQLLSDNLSELHTKNTEKMQKIEKSLRSSKRQADTHEDHMNQVLVKQSKCQLGDLEQSIALKEDQIAKAKDKNDRLTDHLLRLEKILYGKAPL